MQCKQCDDSGHVWAKAYDYPQGVPYGFRCTCRFADRWKGEVRVPVWNPSLSKRYKIVHTLFESIEEAPVQEAPQNAPGALPVQSAPKPVQQPPTPAATAPRPLASKPVAKCNSFVARAVDKEDDLVDLPW